MPRNSSGTYTLPSGNPVVSGTLIEASWANTTLSDLATSMTDSLSRSGEGGMTAALRLFDGTVSSPGLAFSNENSTGLYRAGSGDMRLAVTGSQVMQFLSTGVSVTGTLAVSSTSTFTGAITATGGVVGAVTGNASTATALQTARTIWGQSFNGTANVTGALTGVTDITASGNTSVGGTLAVTGAATFSGQTNTFENSTAYYPQLINRNKTNDANGSYMILEKVRSTSVVQNGDVLGNLVFRGYDGTQYLQGAYINALISATPGTNDMPTDLAFGTTADGGAGPTERVRITQAGNVGVGTASPSYKLDVNGSIRGDTFVRATSGSVGSYLVANSGGGFGVVGTATNHPFLLNTNDTERARIDTSGYWLVNKTSATTYGSIYAQTYTTNSSGQKWLGVWDATVSAGNCQGLYVVYSGGTPNGTANEFIYCTDQTSAQRFVARSNGGLANYSANNVNLSDRREKTNFAPASNYLAKICAIPVQTFNYIDQNFEDDDGLTLGVVAQDVQAVAPELVTESNWGTTEEPKMRLSIYQTDLQYALMKCIQEQQAIIEGLTARITALETTP